MTTTSKLDRYMITCEAPVNVVLADGRTLLRTTIFIAERISATGNRYNLLAAGTPTTADQLGTIDFQQTARCIVVIRNDNVAGMILLPPESVIDRFAEDAPTP